MNLETGALAHVELARAYRLEGEKAKARREYRAFLELWKDADAEIPKLKEVKKEYGELQ